MIVMPGLWMRHGDASSKEDSTYLVVGLARKSGWVEPFTRAEPTGNPGFPTRKIGLWFFPRGAGRLEMPVDLHVMAVRRGLSHTGLLINSMFCTIQYQFCATAVNPCQAYPGTKFLAVVEL